LLAREVYNGTIAETMYNGDTLRELQQVRDFITRKLMNDLEHKNKEIGEG
jgi:hypothetical protein